MHCNTDRRPAADRGYGPIEMEQVESLPGGTCRG